MPDIVIATCPTWDSSGYHISILRRTPEVIEGGYAIRLDPQPFRTVEASWEPPFPANSRDRGEVSAVVVDLGILNSGDDALVSTFVGMARGHFDVLPVACQHSARHVQYRAVRGLAVERVEFAAVAGAAREAVDRFGGRFGEALVRCVHESASNANGTVLTPEALLAGLALWLDARVPFRPSTAAEHELVGRRDLAPTTGAPRPRRRRPPLPPLNPASGWRRSRGAETPSCACPWTRSTATPSSRPGSGSAAGTGRPGGPRRKASRSG